MLYPDSRSGYFDIRKLQSQLLLSGKRKCKNLSKVFTVFRRLKGHLFFIRSEILGLFFPVHYVIKKNKFSGFGLADIIRKKNSTISNLTQIYITRKIQTKRDGQREGDEGRVCTSTPHC